VWEQELYEDPNRDYLPRGLSHGFRITDGIGSHRQKHHLSNHQSALLCKPQVEKELRGQTQAGHCIVTQNPPAIVSPIAAIPKGGSSDSVHLIHDGSRPLGEAMNDFATLHSVKFATIDDAVKLAKKDYYMAKGDLKSAYHSVPIHPDDYGATGLRRKLEGEEEFTYLFDSRLPFGARLGPSIFHRLSQAVRRAMAAHGFDGLVVYIDDFLVVSKTKEHCNEALHFLIRLLRKLGFGISWAKVVAPTQRLVFLGILIDTTECTLGLDDDKLAQLQDKLLHFCGIKRATKRQLQSLAGLLNWACQAIRGGWFFLHRILDMIPKLKHGTHKA